MANPPKGVTVYGIERATAEICNHYFASPLPPGHGYEGEVRIKHAPDAIDLLVIPPASANTDWANDARERLQARSAEALQECVASYRRGQPASDDAVRSPVANQEFACTCHISVF
jgi:hypothetical protein